MLQREASTDRLLPIYSIEVMSLLDNCSVSYVCLCSHRGARYTELRSFFVDRSPGWKGLGQIILLLTDLGPFARQCTLSAAQCKSHPLDFPFYVNSVPFVCDLMNQIAIVSRAVVVSPRLLWPRMMTLRRLS